MPTDATIVLQSLNCTRESDGSGHSEPYIWPTLLWIDDITLGTPDLVGVTAPILANARVVIKSDMRAGQTADIPFPLGTLGVRFEDNLSMRRLILAVALWEEDETPEAAVWAGCKAFSVELRAAIAARLFDLQAADEDARGEIIEEIKAQVRAGVDSAIRNALTGWQKARVLLGTLNLDDIIGSDFTYFPDATPTNINLNIADGSSNVYSIQGVLQVRTPTVDLCQTDVDRVKAAQAVVDSIESQRSILQTQLHHATPAQKAAIIAQIKQLGEELAAAMTLLEDARRVLQACRERWSQMGKVKGTDVTVLGTL